MLRDELLGGEIFYSLREAQVVIERWRWHCNVIRPHSSLGSTGTGGHCVANQPDCFSAAVPATLTLQLNPSLGAGQVNEFKWPAFSAVLRADTF